MQTSFGFTSLQLLSEEHALMLPSLDHSNALEIGEIAKSLGHIKKLPIAIEIRLLDWMVYHASLPGSNIENQNWLDRKARVVILKHHSTLYERVHAIENKINWFEVNNVPEIDYAIHGGGLPLVSKNEGFVGVLLISGLPHVEDHLFGVEVLTEYLARIGDPR
jgi:uncharacterized protein (UPF0303 family)